jgi:AcrR family transcriptional regulator
MKRRDKILLIAEEEFARVGYDGLSMNDLVKKLQINKATIYYHFEDKKSLYQGVTKNAITHINQSLEGLYKKHLKPPQKRDLDSLYIK